MLKHQQTRPTRSAQRSMRLALLAGCSLCLLGLLFLIGGSTGVARAATSAQLASQTSLQPLCVTLPHQICNPNQDNGGDNTIPDPGATFTGCTGGSTYGPQWDACSSFWYTISSWYPWFAAAAVAIGCVWIFAGAFQAAGKTGEGDFSSWKLLLDRVKIAGLIFFVLWRLNDISNGIQNIWFAHTSDQDLSSPVAAPPVQIPTQLWGTLIIILIQVFLAWLVLRLLTTSLWGIASMAGDGGGRPLGPIMAEIIELLGLGALIIFLPSLMTWLLSLLTS